MMPELIEACASLCGWVLWTPGTYNSFEKDRRFGRELMAIEYSLTDAGLLAVEAALLYTEAWRPDYWAPHRGFAWILCTQPNVSVMHQDRATAAALAAKAELEGKDD